ncbi:DUF2605 domain-containing protein [Synechococcus sp. C9]|uniref:DUF2605 domain-containing protein n=1 Tax=Synechococcus sp. C9 TaxID=102119 RepID=UPI001FF6E89E|nr:DUF2605 domain-containing protein [Synechococcus sp. C9]
MNSPHLPHSPIVKSLLEPLLSDFVYWFSQARQMLEGETLPFLEPAERQALLAQINQAQQEVQAAHALLSSTGVGVDTTVLMTWHRLVLQCWHLRMQTRTHPHP